MAMFYRLIVLYITIFLLRLRMSSFETRPLDRYNRPDVKRPQSGFLRRWLPNTWPCVLLGTRVTTRETSCDVVIPHPECLGKRREARNWPRLLDVLRVFIVKRKSSMFFCRLACLPSATANGSL